MCDKSFISPGELNIHHMVLTGEKPHSCSDCDKSFTKNNSLRRHQMIHKGQKPYFCSLCDKSYKTSSELKIHWMTHTGEKPHSCSYCDKLFKTGGELRTHQMTHTGKTGWAQWQENTNVIVRWRDGDKVSLGLVSGMLSLLESVICFIIVWYRSNLQEVLSLMNSHTLFQFQSTAV